MFQQVNASLSNAVNHLIGSHNNDTNGALLTRLAETVQDLQLKLSFSSSSEQSSNKNHRDELESVKAVLVRCERKLDQLLTEKTDLEAGIIADPLTLLREVILPFLPSLLPSPLLL